jgi:hypothetical protein
MELLLPVLFKMFPNMQTSTTIQYPERDERRGNNLSLIGQPGILLNLNIYAQSDALHRTPTELALFFHVRLVECTHPSSLDSLKLQRSVMSLGLLNFVVNIFWKFDWICVC